MVISSLTLLLALVCRVAPDAPAETAPYLVVLGVAQDGGLPHAGCRKNCCGEAWNNPKLHHRVSCLALVDPVSSEHWLFDATPDFKFQLHALEKITGPASLSGIFLTHGHIGHYTGLMQLGREVISAGDVVVYAMPRMMDFLSRNGPWDQLVRLKNIALRPLQNDVPIILNSRLQIAPFLVPHRDEYTETVGFRITGPRKSIVFIPDIDKWEKWDRRIEEVIAGVEVAYLDGTFYADGEIPGRNMAEIPHPFIVETMARLASLPAAEKGKVRFIHLNHTNPALQKQSAAAQAIEKAGFRVAKEGEQVKL
ncbi:MAG: MBL fold metallo-hydrolase [candidate division KSB1 bacterium]|nr:MBL fold metallo-hydrolase [candidate division KSB1 bacterium]MDZ7368980.1 MBL fold metallo-hydrolase [candidate division KSB1 bacterium]MDZ7406982.1 MBL fold metallo-hydrolase [candidate division KSB1 bacterium]